MRKDLVGACGGGGEGNERYGLGRYVQFAVMMHPVRKDFLHLRSSISRMNLPRECINGLPEYLQWQRFLSWRV